MKTIKLTYAQIGDAVMAADAIVHTQTAAYAPIGRNLLPAVERLIGHGAVAVAGALDGVTATADGHTVTFTSVNDMPVDAGERLETALTWTLLQMFYTGVDNVRATRCSQMAAMVTGALSAAMVGAAAAAAPGRLSAWW